MHRGRTHLFRAQRAPRGEGGFSIVESMIALGLIFTVLMGMLASLSTGVRGVVRGRQRTGAVALTREVLELTRSVGYDAVGHDLDSDTTLSTDTALTVAGTFQWTYEGEALAGSNRNQDADSPFYPHRWTRTVDATDYTVNTYVTLVTPSTADQYKRVTAVVSWTNAQNANGQESIEASSFMFDAQEPPDPLLEGLADVDAGGIDISGSLQATGQLDSAFFWFPTAHGEIESRFIRRANGLAVSPRSQLNLTTSVDASEISGCTVTDSNKKAECAGQKAESVADNDTGTAPLTSAVAGPVTYSGGTVARQGRITVQFGGSNSATSKSTSAATTPTFAENDELPWHQSISSGPASMSIPYESSQVSGRLAECSAVAQATATVDVDTTGSATTIGSTATVSHPALDVLAFDAPEVIYYDNGTTTEQITNYAGLVRLGTTSVTASASAGPGVGAPSLTGNSVTVQLYQPSGAEPGYSTVTFTPGTESSASTSAVFTVDGRRVELDATVTSARAVTRSDASGAVTNSAEVSLTSWLRVVGHLKIYTTDGNLVGDVTIDLDYGRILASAGYEPA